MKTIVSDVCVVGGGPAGLMLALSLAKLGRSVVVLDQSRDFERTFRGESILPDSVWLLHRMGLLDSLKAQRALEGHRLEIVDDGKKVLHVNFLDFGRPQPYPMEVPQPMLLAAIHEAACAYPEFTLLRQHRLERLLIEDDRVTGACFESPDGPLIVRAALTIGADGRYSKTRDHARIDYRKTPLQRDVLWFKLPYPATWAPSTYRIRIKANRHAVFLPTHPDMVRVGFNIPKGGLKALRARGIEALYERIDELAPELAASVRENVRDWSDTLILDIFTTVVPEWSKPGFVLIGDAAHTLSPILGHGVNHALMDAITLAPLVHAALDKPDVARALDDATRQFQLLREPGVSKARNLQLRQERLFAFESPAAAAFRRVLYRMIGRIPLLKRRVLANAYYTVKQTEGTGVIAMELPG